MNLILIFRNAAMVLMACATISSKAQTARIQWGGEMEQKGATADMQVVLSDDKGFYVHEGHLQRSGFFLNNTFKLVHKLQRFDKNFNLVFEKDYADEMKGYTNNQIVALKNDLFVFGEKVEKDDSRRVFGAKLNKQTGEMTEKLQQLYAVKQIGAKPRFSIINPIYRGNTSDVVDIVVKASPDSAYLLVIAAKSTKADGEAAEVTVLDNTLKEVAHGQVKLSDKRGLHFIDDIFYSPGGLLVMGKEYEVESVDRKGRPDVSFKQFFIKHYSINGEELGDFSGGIKGKFVTDASVYKVSSSKWMIAGFYGESSSNPTVQGLFAGDIDLASGKISAVNLIPVSAQMLQNVVEEEPGEKADKKKNKETAANEEPAGFDKSYKIKQLLLAGSESNVVVLAEASYTERIVRMNTNSNGLSNGTTNSVTTINYAKNILSICLDKNNQLKWMTMLPKQQEEYLADVGTSNGSFGTDIGKLFTSDGGWPFFTSFGAAANKEQVMLFFNDNLQNKAVTKMGEKIRRAIVIADTDLYAVTLDVNTGNVVSRKAIYSNAGGPTAMPRFMIPLGTTNTEFLISSMHRKSMSRKMTFNFGKLKIR